MSTTRKRKLDEGAQDPSATKTVVIPFATHTPARLATPLPSVRIFHGGRSILVLFDHPFVKRLPAIPPGLPSCCLSRLRDSLCILDRAMRQWVQAYPHWVLTGHTIQMIESGYSKMKVNMYLGCSSSGIWPLSRVMSYGIYDPSGECMNSYFGAMLCPDHRLPPLRGTGDLLAPLRDGSMCTAGLYGKDMSAPTFNSACASEVYGRDRSSHTGTAIPDIIRRSAREFEEDKAQAKTSMVKEMTEMPTFNDFDIHVLRLVADYAYQSYGDE